MTKSNKGLTFFTVNEIEGSLLECESVVGIGYGELVKIITKDGKEKTGQVIDVSDKMTVIQLFENTSGLNIKSIGIRFTGDTIKLPVSMDMFGRIFSGVGKPIDNGPDIIPEDYLDVHAATINPYSRLHPTKVIQTGISVIDGLNTLLLGQKLPLLSGAGMPHKRLASQIVSQARVPETDEQFTIVFAAMGITSDEMVLFRNDFLKMDAINRVVMFINLAEDPAIERLLTPRFALTAAEYLAFQHDHHVLVIMVDVTNYCEALREISASRLEIPGRRGYPGYMYTDLAMLYERAGIIRGKKGSITMIPILTMPDDDVTHPIADLTNYITEGQIILDRSMFKRGIYPPIDPLICLSRLMDKGIGLNKTREDHKQLSDQLYYAYAEGKTVQETAMVSGEKALTNTDKLYLKFMERFEKEFINQGYYENRDIETTLNIGWDLLSILPESELARIDPEILNKFHPNYLK
ncbi:MAG: V-type ATP synthase subunit B [Candidatus Lokiarchaeota archaeon]|nr:V-type ATP synthase subunit B [Candidatus Lokiarchaeota archaeon]